MISKLRKRIVAINVLTAGLILFVAVIFIFSLGYARINFERRNRMQEALKFRPDEAGTPFSETEMFNDIAIVEYDAQTGNFADVQVGKNFEVTHEALGRYVERAVADRRDSGTVYFKLAYLKQQDGGHVRIAFNNLTSQSTSLTPYFITTVAAWIGGTGVFVMISLVLANIALLPVEDSWNKQKQFVADASHELKTPLSVIMANTDMIASHPDETVAQQMQWIENTREEARRMAELVTQLLFLAKNDDGLQVQMETFDMSECVNTVVLSYDVIFYENQKEFQTDIAPNVVLDGNVGQIKQLVTILLDNANRYSKASGNIFLSLSVVGKHVVLSVENDCEQLSDEQISHLFDRFYTVDPSRNKSVGGNGLGLAIAKTICETHQGSLTATCKEGRIKFVATFNAKIPTKQKRR